MWWSEECGLGHKRIGEKGRNWDALETHVWLAVTK
jgi:hypothetical protein